MSLDEGALISSYEFARLVPADDSARRAFNRIAQRIKTNPHWNPHARRYIVIHSQKTGITSATTDNEESGYDSDVRKKDIWSGYYQLSFGRPPATPQLGWSIGGGQFAASEATVDILLTEKKNFDGVSCRHARLCHNFKSGQLILTSDNNLVVINGVEDVQDARRMIGARVTGLCFGNLRYKLILPDVTELQHRARLEQYSQTFGIKDNEIPGALMSTPAETDYVCKNYQVRNPIGEGGSCIVFAGLHKHTSAPVAVKKMQRNRNTARRIKNEIAMSEFLRGHRRICELVEVLAPENDPHSRTYKTAGVDEMYLIFRPLASWTVGKLLVNPIFIDKARLNVFWQCLDGISYIHDHGCMHRDLKPSNLAVVSLKPPRAMIIDFGQVIESRTSDDVRCVGTPGYCAPEIYALKKDRSCPAYTQAIDIFSFGLCAYQMFCRQRCWWGEKHDNESLSKIYKGLEAKNSYGGVTKLVRNFLSWDAGHRVSAEDAIDEWPDRAVSFDPGEDEDKESLYEGSTQDTDGESMGEDSGNVGESSNDQPLGLGDDLETVASLNRLSTSMDISSGLGPSAMDIS